MIAYTEQLKDPRWQKRRREIFERDNYICTDCGLNGRYRDEETGIIDFCEMHIHHKIYKKNALPWEYDDSELTTLCYVCHKRLHIIKKGGRSNKDYEHIGDILPKTIEELKRLFRGVNHG